jgi:hypothetical protein
VHRLVLSLLPAGTAVTSIQLRASHDSWHRRFEAALDRPDVSEFYRNRYV